MLPYQTQHHNGRIYGHQRTRGGPIKDGFDNRQRGGSSHHGQGTLLGDSYTYRTIPKDPTDKLKNKLIGILKDIKQTSGLKDSTYYKMYPTSAVPPKFYDLRKIHKVGTPRRPIVSCRGSITYGVAKELTGIICPLVGWSPHHLNTLFNKSNR